MTAPILTAQQRIDALLAADFFADDTGRIATRQDVLDALPIAPRPVSLPVLPWRVSQ